MKKTINSSTSCGLNTANIEKKRPETEANFADDLLYMKVALEEADKARVCDEVPVGVVILSKDGSIISKAHNFKEKSNDPCGHAEIIAIRKAAQKLGNWRLLDCTLYVTLEPCVMCLAAMYHARIKKLVFGAYDPKGGALSLNYDIYKDVRLNHNFSVIGGVSQYDCSRLISSFFADKRRK